MTRATPERWFEVWGADDADAFVTVLRQEAESWPPADTLSPINTGGWQREGFLITYVDVCDRAANAVVTSFRADFDGHRVLAAEVWPSHVDQDGFFEDLKPGGESPVEIAVGDALECARAAAGWYRKRLFGR
jgi:hypothetical protein